MSDAIERTGVCELDEVFASVVPNDGRPPVLFARDLYDVQHGDEVSVEFHPIAGVTELKNVKTGKDYTRN